MTPSDPSTDAIWTSVYAAVDELNEGLPTESRVPKSPDAVLFGVHGRLGSLHTLNLIYLIEQRVNEQLGSEINLAETLVSQDGAELPETLEKMVAVVRRLSAA